MRGQYSGHVTSLDQSEASIQSPASRAESESPEPSGFRFERTGPFYKSTRFRETEDRDYRDYQDMTSPTLDNIPEKYFVTVSGFEDTGLGDSVHVTSGGPIRGQYSGHVTSPDQSE